MTKMRYVPINCLVSKMVVANSVYDAYGDLLVPQGTALTRTLIEALKRLDFNGIYIEENFGGDEPVGIVSTITRRKAVSAVKRMFGVVNVEGVTPKQAQAVFEPLVVILDDIIDQVCNNKNLMINMVDLKNFDDYTYNHSVNVAVLAIALGESFGLSRNELYNLGVGAMLHDIGKAFVPMDIINKPEGLTDVEIMEVRKHPAEGLEYVENYLDVPYDALSAVIDHHERYDGTGYPAHKRGDAISLYGAIVAVADVFDAIITDKPYRRGYSNQEAVEYIMGGAGTQFDPKVVSTFVKRISPYPVGGIVKLSNGDIARVIMCTNRSLRPVVSVYMRDGVNLESPIVLDLQDSKYFNITIVEEIRSQEQSFVKEGPASEHNIRYVRRR